MTNEHRTADILAQLFHQNTQHLAANLAKAFEERDALKTRIAELETKLAEATKPGI